MKIIILGAPGAGKGTQAEIISKHLQIPTISTGNIIREALKSGSEMGQKAKEYIDSGRLVPDDVVIGIIQERLAEPDCKDGFILDGFPRTIPQAEALDRMGVVIDRVIDIEVDDDVIARRVSGRRVCPGCGASYHLEYKLPEVKACATIAKTPLFSARMTSRKPFAKDCAYIMNKPSRSKTITQQRTSSLLSKARRTSPIQPG